MIASARSAGGPRARAFRVPLEGPTEPLQMARWLRHEPRGVALSGKWTGGGVLLSSHPLATAGAGEDPFAALDAPPVELEAGEAGGGALVGGGWLGWFGFGLAREVESIPPPPPRPVPIPRFDLAFHDHVVRCDVDGRWWFEALWTAARSETLRDRLESWRARLLGPPPPPRPFAGGPLRVAPPGTAGHGAAVADAIKRISEGEMSQANICLRLEGGFAGDPLDLWVQAAAASGPAYAAYFGGQDHAVLSLSPELFLRRRGRVVETRPIKGTAPRASDPAELTGSAKDRAENVMIVDLMRNDLGRVCQYGSVVVDELFGLEPAPGVWHLVSTVRGRLRPDVGDRQLLRATFPPGSVTGAPKRQALRVIHELESTAREAYCGAAGLCSPLSGLELNVMIRTFEVRGERLWLGAGGGVVSDSSPEAEVEEALDKARGIAAAGAIEIVAPVQLPPSSSPAIVRRPRPDAALGVIETILVRDGGPVRLAEHLARLRASCATLGLSLPPGLEESILRATAGAGHGGIRVAVDAAGVNLSVRSAPRATAMALTPVALPGGLGAHKWADRRLIDELSTTGSTPLFCDLDGSVLEAGYAAVLVVIGTDLLAPALDGRLLASVSRGHALAAAPRAGLQTVIRPFTLDEVRAADAIVLTSSLRGPHPGVLAGGPSTSASQRFCDALA